MRRTITVVSVLASVVFLSACDHLDGPVRPTVQIARVQLALDGPGSVAPGGVLHYRVTATQTGLAPQDVTASAFWSSDSPDELRSTAPGIYVAASSRGETDISARYKDAVAQTHIYVLEDGTFSVRGHVRDGAYAAPGARIAVVAGTGTGLSATSGADGAYVLLGVGGTATLTANLEGYAPGVQTVDVNGQTTADFSLNLVQPRPDISGAWSLAFTASPSCTGLPDEVLQRIYPLTIVQQGAALNLSLTLLHSAWPLTDTLHLDGRLLGRTMTLRLPNDDFDGPLVYEILSSGSRFTLYGDAAADLNAGSFHGYINGQIRVFDAGPVVPLGLTCARSDHGLVLTRPGGSTPARAGG